MNAIGRWYLTCGLVFVCACIATVLVNGCYKTEYSQELQEPGRVEQVLYLPSSTSSGVGVSPNDGHAVVVSTTAPEQWVIVFSCKHGKFTLDPHSEKTRQLYQSLKQGDSVDIIYREVYRVTEKDGTRVTTLHDLDFLDAHLTRVER